MLVIHHDHGRHDLIIMAMIVGAQGSS